MMAIAPISGVLLDVGGTLWPGAWPSQDGDAGARVARLSGALPSLTAASALDLVRLLEARVADLDVVMAQDTDALVRNALDQLGIGASSWEVVAIRRAMCLPAAERVQLFPRARELLATIKALGLGCALVSNSAWRDSHAYQRDLEDLGVARYADAIVTSVDTGFRKPHDAMFKAALATIGCAAEQAVMIGNSERNDIAPAIALQMRAIRVAIEEPRPATSAAHAIAGSLHEVAGLLRSWMWADSA